MIRIDGSFGEGGGQILRTSLSLSLLTGKPFRINKIRAGRKKTGLLRQHLTAVNAAAKIGNAKVRGNDINSLELVFEPEKIISGDYHFKIGTAGSATLVLQTVLPALIFGKGESKIKLEGGTHNPYAPPFDFLKYCFLPCLKKMGVDISCKLNRYGFYPAGGGEFQVIIEPVKKLNSIEITEKGSEKSIEVIGLGSDIPFRIADEEVKIILTKMNWDPAYGKTSNVKSQGPGNIVFAKLEYENICEVFTGFGQRGVSLKRVADKVVKQIRKYIDADVPVGEYLSDQLLIPLAITGSGKYRTHIVTKHTLTNIAILKKFIDVDISYNKIENNNYEIEVKGVAYEMDKK